MKKEFIECGKIVGIHGIKGFVKLLPWCDSADFVCGFKKLYIGKSKNEYSVLQAKPHKNIVLLQLSGVATPEQAANLNGFTVYINRNDVSLDEGQYFISDLLGCEVFDFDTSKLLGKISDVSETGANDVWHINQNGKEYLIPVIDDVVISVDIDAQKVIIKPLKGIFNDED